MIGSSGFISSDYEFRFVIELWEGDNCLSKQYYSDFSHARNSIMSFLDDPSKEGSPELHYKLFDGIIKQYINYQDF